MKKTKSQENAIRLDPNRERMSKSLAYVPGGPPNTQTTNPGNFLSYGPQTGSLSGVNENMYRDGGLANDSRFGAESLNPVYVPPSGLQQSFPVAGRGLNRTPYGMAPTSPAEPGNSPVWEGMEGARYADRRDKELPTHPALGMTGMPALMKGQMPSDMGGTSGSFLPAYSSLTPGATPQKIGKKEKK